MEKSQFEQSVLNAATWYERDQDKPEKMPDADTLALIALRMAHHEHRAAQVLATLALALQTKRVADVLERSTNGELITVQAFDLGRP